MWNYPTLFISWFINFNGFLHDWEVHIIFQWRITIIKTWNLSLPWLYIFSSANMLCFKIILVFFIKIKSRKVLRFWNFQSNGKTRLYLNTCKVSKSKKKTASDYLNPFKASETWMNVSLKIRILYKLLINLFHAKPKNHYIRTTFKTASKVYVNRKCHK